MKHSLAKYSVFPWFATCVTVAVMLIPVPWWAGTAVFLAYIGIHGAVWGRRMMPRERVWWQIFLGALTVLAALTAVGGVVYFASSLDVLMTAVLLLGVGSVSTGLGFFERVRGRAVGEVFHAETGGVDEGAKSPVWRRVVAWVLVGVAVGLVAYMGMSIVAFSTEISIRSPWDVVPPTVIGMLFLAVLAVAAGAMIAVHEAISIVALSAVAGLSVSIAALAYKIGFGFDPFIHQATEQAILAHGAVLPKPFYYLGHYAIVTLFARMSRLPISSIDAWLVPVLFMLAVPVAYWSVRRATSATASSAALASGATLLLLPLAAFIPSTPQGHANAWFVMTAFLCLPAMASRTFPRRILALFAFAACAVHPLAGIPLLILVGFTFVASVFEQKHGSSDAGRLFLMAQLVIFGSVAMPAVFVLHSLVAGGGARLDFETLQNPSRIWDVALAFPEVSRRFVASLDVAYAWRWVRTPFFVLAALVGIAVGRRKTRGATVHTAAAVVFFANYVLLKTVIDFPFLISYERSSYADRMIDLALFALAAPVALGLTEVMERMRRATPTVRIAVPLLLAIAVTSSVYVAYPRRDRYENSRGWSTGSADVATVQAIDKDAGGKEYVVLANQATSAAAIREFGFKQYFSSSDAQHPEPVFFYPVPTGGALYEVFLAMNDEAGSREVATEAMDLAGVDRAYFAVSKYWWDARRITLGAKKEADKAWTTGEDVYVFRYERKR